jgi:tRNA threonylcarbamoyladenosine biosynthesis protein TsaE
VFPSMTRFGELLPLITRSPDETVAAGVGLSSHLGAGDVLALFGDLGAGKTHLVKGICAGFGIPPEEVSSPTFTLVNEYRGAAVTVYHVDAYRIRSQAELYEFGYEEYFFGDGLCLIEWPERVGTLLPENAIRLCIDHGGDDSRRISLCDSSPATETDGR